MCYPWHQLRVNALWLLHVSLCLMELLLKRVQSEARSNAAHWRSLLCQFCSTCKAENAVQFWLNCHSASTHANLFSSDHCLQLIGSFWAWLSCAAFQNSMQLLSFRPPATYSVKEADLLWNPVKSQDRLKILSSGNQQDKMSARVMMGWWVKAESCTDWKYSEIAAAKCASSIHPFFSLYV